jgi:NRAMP (natural resistance-associated macrophage protein)-like metal ion transporter
VKKHLFTKTLEAPTELLEKSIITAEALRQKLNSEKTIKAGEDYWKTLGPGLTTGASDDDPSGIATYSQAGAQFSFQLLWMAAVTFPLMAVVQEMCARIGLVTGRGLASNIRRLFSKKVLYACTTLLFAANAFNIGADLGAMAAGVRLLFPHLDYALLVISFALLMLGLQIFTPYARYAKYLKWLALVLFAYVLAAILAHLNWTTVLKHAIIPTVTFSKDQLLLICGILGTTISPYLFFWQTSQEVEEEIVQGKTTILSRQGTDKHAVKNMRIDVWSGMFLSNLVMFFIIAACAGVLYPQGITHIDTAAQAAEALRPFAGNATFFLFAIGIIGTGLLAIPVLAGSSSYAIAESLMKPSSLGKKIGQARAFYGVIIMSMLVGLSLNFVGINPIKALIYSAIANGLVAPVILVLIVLISSNKKIMGEWVNKTSTKFIGWATTVLMVIAGGGAIFALFN